mmetsp:Transcript_22747/g.31708  ORF Transcript_22747/g.31708 Transcript_22747/m.31708 type:complete len:148 (+) Transcript_22747:250-693(+)
MQQRADGELNALVDNFCNLVKAARISDTMRNAQENLQIDVHAARIAQAGEALLVMTSELKRDALLSDFESMNAAVAARQTLFNTHTQQTENSLQSITQEVEGTLSRLEYHYYSSRCRPKDHVPREESCPLLQSLELIASKSAPIEPQ